jgi:uncharacterized membrane protein
MPNTFKYILVIGNFFGFILVVIALWRFKKTLKEHRKTSNDDFLSESEKIVQKKSIKILIIGFIVICITNLIQLVLLFSPNR